MLFELNRPYVSLLLIFIVNQVFDEVEQIKREHIAILLVERDLSHSLSVANHRYIFENGRMVLDSKGDVLLNNKLVKEVYMGI